MKKLLLLIKTDDPKDFLYVTLGRTRVEQWYKLNSLNQGSIPSLLHDTLLILREITFFFREVFPILQPHKDPYIFLQLTEISNFEEV